MLHHFEPLYVYLWHMCFYNCSCDKAALRVFFPSPALLPCQFYCTSTLYSHCISTTCVVKSQQLRVLQSKKNLHVTSNFALLQKMPYCELLFYICLLVLLPYDWVLWNTISSSTYQPGADDGNIKGKQCFYTQHLCCYFSWEKFH